MSNFAWTMTFGELLVFAGFIASLWGVMSKVRKDQDERISKLVEKIEAAAEKRTAEREQQNRDIWLRINLNEREYVRREDLGTHLQPMHRDITEVKTALDRNTEAVGGLTKAVLGIVRLPPQAP